MSASQLLKNLSTETAVASTLNGYTVPASGGLYNAMPLYSAVVSPPIADYNSLGQPAPLVGAYFTINNFHPRITTNSIMTAVCIGGSGNATDQVKGGITQIDGNTPNNSITVWVNNTPTTPLSYFIQVWRW